MSSIPVLVAVAWPYANAEIHVGNLTGSDLPADIFARFHRLKGNQVLMVSGSDAHGTPITVRADAEKTTAHDVYQRFHAGFLDLFQRLGLTYDLFTSTHTANHFQVSQTVFMALKQNGYLYTAREMQWFSPAQNRFLPDRYVEGTCYICGYDNARSDQCDKCGNLLDGAQLINPRSKVDGSTPELRETEHFYLDLGQLQPFVEDYLRTHESYWRPNVLRQSLGQMTTEKLRGRPITRDLDWGIPLPIEGWEGKCLYVWFEAVIGYLSASIEWARLTGQPDAWKNWWHNPEARSYYFIGKDNIPFHAVIWPAQLIGCGTTFDTLMKVHQPSTLNLPYDVPANEFMNLEGQKISGSRNWAVWGRDFLDRYDPDPLRYYLTANMPETRDSDWDWNEFFQRNNNELVATWGNLANRVLAFTYKHWNGCIPDPGELRNVDLELLETVEDGFTTVAEHLDAVRLRQALAEAMRLATEVNRYLDTNAPWFEIKTDKDQAAKSVYTALCAINYLKVMFAPFLPFTSEKLHTYLGFTKPLFGTQTTQVKADSLGEHTVLLYQPGECDGRWEAERLTPGSALQPPQPLFRKLDPSIVEEERARLGRKA
ncbi:MAG TPA: methionine--tRNA ligase [Anaerolineaceae bacterium]|nr:methionine--tRNA ligase [Anaerolineaceae bacterium]HPN51386.1 methionine--tRNA ligase [Anaerolineaceae bacterium]